MTARRALGYHFTQTSVLITEAFRGRGDELRWEIFKQPNYELPPEWLALYKEAIPNLYDTHNQVFGFQALPAIWNGLTQGRLRRYDAEFFRAVAQGAVAKARLTEFGRFLKYSLVYHIKPQPDEELAVTLVVEDLAEEELGAVWTALQQEIAVPNLTFISVISTQEALLRYIWYRSLTTGEDITSRRLLVINVGYTFSEFTLWMYGEPEEPMRAQGMRQIDMGVCDTLRRDNERARSLDLGDLVVYAQRARADYERGQASIPILQTNGSWIEMPEDDYLGLVRQGVEDITQRLQRAVRSRAGQIDQVIVAGEGAAFAPVTEQIASVLDKLSMPQPLILAHSPVACAQGAAGLSDEILSSTREAQ